MSESTCRQRPILINSRPASVRTTSVHHMDVLAATSLPALPGLGGRNPHAVTRRHGRRPSEKVMHLVPLWCFGGAQHAMLSARSTGIRPADPKPRVNHTGWHGSGRIAHSSTPARKLRLARRSVGKFNQGIGQPFDAITPGHTLQPSPRGSPTRRTVRPVPHRPRPHSCRCLLRPPPSA